MSTDAFKDLMDYIARTSNAHGWSGMAIVDSEASQAFTMAHRGKELIFAFIDCDERKKGDHVQFFNEMRAAGHRVYNFSNKDREEIEAAYRE